MTFDDIKVGEFFKTTYRNKEYLKITDSDAHLVGSRCKTYFPKNHIVIKLQAEFKEYVVKVKDLKAGQKFRQKNGMPGTAMLKIAVGPNNPSGEFMLELSTSVLWKFPGAEAEVEILEDNKNDQ